MLILPNSYNRPYLAYQNQRRRNRMVSSHRKRKVHTLKNFIIVDKFLSHPADRQTHRSKNITSMAEETKQVTANVQLTVASSAVLSSRFSCRFSRGCRRRRHLVQIDPPTSTSSAGSDVINQHRVAVSLPQEHDESRAAR